MAAAPLPMPWLLRWGYRLSILFGVLLFIGAVLTSFGWSDVSGLKNAPFGEWNIPVWVGNAFIASVFMVVIGYSIRNQQPNSRSLICAFWAVSVALAAAEYFIARQQSGSLVAGVWLATVALNSILTIAVGGWYLFGKRSVRQYFESLRAPTA
jgi:hypothetical protein